MCIYWHLVLKMHEIIQNRFISCLPKKIQTNIPVLLLFLFIMCILTVIPGRRWGWGSGGQSLVHFNILLWIAHSISANIRWHSKQILLISAHTSVTEHVSDQLQTPLHLAFVYAWIHVLWLRFVEEICKCGACQSKPFVKGIIRLKVCFWGE